MAEGDPPPLEGPPWQAVEVLGQPVPAGIQVTFAIDAAGQASGNAGCNGWGGRATRSGDALKFGPIRATRMACEAERMAVEADFLSALAQVTAVGGDDSGALLLLADGAVVAVLRR